MPVFNSPNLEPRQTSFSTRELLVIGCSIGLLLCFFAPWTSLDGGISGLSFHRYDKAGGALWAIPILALLTLMFCKEQTASSRFGAITAIATWGGMAFFLTRLSVFGVFSLKWGASLTVLFALGLFAFSGERKFSIPVDLVAKRLSSRKAQVYSHWGTFTPDIHFAAQDFYRNLEDAIRAKKWPGVELLRIEYSEAGLLSHKREYLRVIRQRQVFDICAATFGKDYFFSLREAEIPSVITVRAFLSITFGAFILLGAFIQILGVIFGLFAAVFLLLFAVWFLFNVVKMGLTKVDSMLLTLPVLGPVYENWFRQDTYFQQDSRILFLQSVSELVKTHVEETTSEKGLKFLNCFEKKPILGGLYTPAVFPLKRAA